MCSPNTTDIVKPNPVSSDTTDILSFLKNAFGYDFEQEDIPIIFKMSDPLDELYATTKHDGTNVNSFISFLSSCVRMYAESGDNREIYQSSFEYLWGFARLRFSSIFENSGEKNKVLTDVQHQCLHIWAELYKLSKMNFLTKLLPIDGIQGSTLERIINQGFSAILLNVWSMTDRVVPCSCVASAWDVYLSLTSKPVEELNNIYKTVIGGGVRPVPTVAKPDIGEWGTVKPTIEVDVPYSAKHHVVMRFNDAVTTAVTRLTPETILTTIFALYPHVCTDFKQVEAFSKNLSPKIKTFSYGLYRSLVEFMERVPTIVPSLSPYMKTITKKMAADNVVDDLTLQLSSYADFCRIVRTATGSPCPSDDEFIFYVNLLVKCVTIQADATKLDKLVADVGSLWSFDASGTNPTSTARYCLLLASLSASTKLPSVFTQMVALGDTTATAPFIWMFFLALPMIDTFKWNQLIDILKRAILKIFDEYRSDLLEALQGIMAVIEDASCRRQILSLFPNQLIKALPPSLLCHFFSIIQTLPEVKEYSKAFLTPLVLSTDFDINVLSTVAAIQIGFSKLDFWKQLMDSQSRIDTNVLTDFAIGVFDKVSTVFRGNYGVVCGMAMFLAIVKAGNQKANASIHRTLALLKPNDRSGADDDPAIDALLTFVPSSPDVLDDVYDLSMIQRIAATLRHLPNVQRLEPLRSCCKVLCQTDFSRWSKRNISANELPHVRLINSIIKPFLVQQDFGMFEPNYSARKEMLLKVSRCKLPNHKSTVKFIENFFGEVSKALAKLPN